MKINNDVITISIITLIYAVISFINLGSTKNPQTFWKLENYEDCAIIKLEKKNIDKIRCYTGAEIGEYKLYISKDGENFNFASILKGDRVFAWHDDVETMEANYIKIVGTQLNSYLGEIAFYNTLGEIINAIAINENAKNLIDEQETVPKKISFMNSTYFDEIYYSRTAYEYLNGLEIYEWTHPPLGKLLMSFSIAIFGVTPFAYRLMGNIAGILMIPIMYVFARNIFKDKKYAILAAVIMACDNFHFVQTRIATVDSFLTLFIILSYFFMYKYITLEENTKLRKKLLMLLLSGLFMGLGIATKWTACFSAIGLAIIFLTKLIKINNKKEIGITLFSCVLFFVIIPIVIYVACYIPHNGVDSLKDFWNLQIDMYKYHSELKDAHPYSSKWYTWFIMQRPVWYYLGETEEGMRSTISGIGNPIIWWNGFIAMVYVFIKGITKLEKECWFMMVAILVNILPYIGIDRVMFMYHYFPILPFMILCIVILIKDIETKTRLNNFRVVFTIIILMVFIYFYPVVSGMTVPEKYIESTKWLSSWNY